MKAKCHSHLIYKIAIGGVAVIFSIQLNAAPKKKSPSSQPSRIKNTVEKKTSLDELKWVEGDERGNEEKALKAEVMVSRAEQKAIQQALSLIKKHKGTGLEPGLQFRLAELYMRKSKTDRFFEIHRQSETVVRLAPQLVTSASSKEAIRKAIATYSYMEKQFPNFPQMDLVLFNHAFASQAIGQDKDAEALYWNLVRRYNSSPLVPEAHLAIGEISFGRAQFNHALEHFNSVKKYPKSRVYPYGLYKAAWTYYNLRDAASAMSKLEEVVAYGRMVTKNKVDARLDLRKEALIDMTIFYEDVYPAKDAFKYFRAQAGELDVSPSITRLGEIYERHSRFDDQRELLSQFIAQMPESRSLPEVYERLILALDHLRQIDGSVKRLEAFYQLCQPSSRWSQSVAKSPEIADAKTKECSESLGTTSLNLAKRWLKQWKKVGKDETYANSAEKAFEIFLRAPGHGDEYSQARYAYAELLFQRSKFRQASREYAAISKTGAGATLAHDAAYAAILSLERAVGDKNGGGKNDDKNDEKNSEKWSAEDEKSFYELATAYVAKNPKGQYRLDIEFKIALLAYEKSRYDEAGPLFLRLGKEFSGEAKGQKAQDLYLDILNIKKDYKAVRTYSAQLLKAGPEVARGDKLQKLYEGAYFLEIQGLEEKNQARQALQEYLSFARTNLTSPLTEKAIWNAMQLHFKVGEDFEGAAICEEYALKFPKSDQAVNALLKAAQTYEQMGQLGPAARVLTRLSEVDLSSRKKWKELAADFYAISGQLAVSRKLYNELKTEAHGKALVQIVAKIETLEKNYGTAQSHADSLRALVDLGVQPQAGEGRTAQVEKMFEAGKMTDAFNEARRLLGSGSNLNSSQRARVRFVQARVLEQEFLKQSVKGRAERIATVLAIKTEKLEKAQEAFQSSIKFGDARITVQALERLYGCYSHYVMALREMPTPAGLTPSDETAFRNELQTLMVPLEEKSVDTLQQALTFAKKQQFIDGTVTRLEEQLSKINMQASLSTSPRMQMPGIVLPLIAEVGP